GVPAGGGRHGAGVDVGDDAAGVVVREAGGVAGRVLGGAGGVELGAGAGQAQRLHDPGAGDVVVGAAGDVLDDEAEQAVADVRVLEVLVGREDDALGADAL